MKAKQFIRYYQENKESHIPDLHMKEIINGKSNEEIEKFILEGLEKRRSFGGRRQWERYVNDKIFLSSDIKLKGGGILSYHLEMTELKEQQGI